jgi:hypothetical protein
MGFQLITGEVPFTADSMVGVIQHHYMTPVPDILLVRPEVPKDLLDVVYCALNKDPKDRFATTRDMAIALENIVLSDADREEADRLLRQLSSGEAIPKVRTGTLPPLALTISGPGPRVQPRPSTLPRSRAIPSVTTKRKKKKSNKFLYQGLAISALTVVSAGYLAYQQSADAEAARVRQEQAYQDSIARAQARSAAVSTRGKVVFTGLPSNVRLSIGGRVFVPGVVDSMEPGRYVAEARAAGYRDLNREFAVTAGRTDTIVITMSLAVASQPTLTSRETTKAAPPVRVDTSEVRLAVLPLHAEIFVNGRSVGKGRARDRLPAGAHTVRYQAVGCVPEEATISVSDGRPLVVPPRTLNCQ